MKVSILILFLLSIAAQAKMESIHSTTRSLVGFRLTHVDKGSIYEKAGLKIGDLVQTLNGKAVAKPEDLKELPEILKRDKKVEVKVERAGKIVHLRYRTILRSQAALTNGH